MNRVTDNACDVICFVSTAYGIQRHEGQTFAATKYKYSLARTGVEGCPSRVHRVASKIKIFKSAKRFFILSITKS